MSSDIITALITGLCVAVPTIITTLTTNKARNSVIEERINNLTEKIDDLTQKVEKHNSYSERLALVEASAKSAHHRIDDIITQLEITDTRKGAKA